MTVSGIVGAYGGEPMMVEYPNGDRVAYITVAFECHLDACANPFPDREELLELGWFDHATIADLPRRDWIDRIIADCA